MCLYNSEFAGSGLGQFGLTAVKTLQMKHLIMTDFHHNVINALDFHSRLNLTDTGRDYNRISELTKISCLRDSSEIPLPSLYSAKNSSELFDHCLDEGPPGKFTEATVTGARQDIPDHSLAIQQLDWRYYKPEAGVNNLTNRNNM